MRQRLQKGLQIWSGTQSHSLACSITWVLCTQITLTWYLSHLFHHTKLKTLSNNFYHKLHMISACQHFKQQKVNVPRQGDAIQLWDCWEATGRQPQSLTGHLDFRKVKKKKPNWLSSPSLPCAQTPKCSLMWTQDSFCCQLSSTELSALWCRKERNWAWGWQHFPFSPHFQKPSPSASTFHLHNTAWTQQSPSD